MKKSLVWLGVALAVLLGCTLSLTAGGLVGGLAGYLTARRAPEMAVPRPLEELVPPQMPWEQGPEPWRQVPEPWELPPREIPERFPWQLSGALIVEVDSNGPADQARLEVGDIIIAVDNTAMDERHALARLIRSHKPGDDVVLTVLRTDDETKINELEVTLGRDRDEDGEVVARLGVRYRTVGTALCLPVPDSGPWD